MLLQQEQILSTLNEVLNQIPKIRKGTDAVYYCPVCKHYKRYIMQGIIMRNAIGYIPKPQNYTQENIQQDMTPPPEAEDVDEDKKTEETNGNSENSETKDEKSEDVSEDPLDPIKLMKVAVSLDQKPWRKPLDKNLIE